MASARVHPFSAQWYGFAVSRRRQAVAGQDYWATARVANGWQTELAGLACPADWQAFDTTLLGATDAGARLITYDDPRSGQYRMAVFREGRLDAALFIAPKPLGIARAFLAAALTEAPSETEGLRLLAGRPGAGRIDRGETVYSCFQIGLNQILAAITTGWCATVAEVGSALKAGTDCGSCRPEIQRLLSRAPSADVQPQAL